MDIHWSVMLKLIHVALAFGFVTGLIGRGILLRRAEHSTDIALTTVFTEASAPFERMTILSSMLIFPAGLATAWAQGYPWLGLTTGWIIASVAIYVALTALVPTIFLPSGKRFGAAMLDAQQAGQVTPQLQAAFRDPAVRFAHVAELVGVATIILMVTKPF